MRETSLLTGNNCKSFSVHLGDPEITASLGASIGQRVRPGDTLLLSGQLGAGKSHLARAIIQTAMGVPNLSVPSPSYTLVNVYHPACGGEIWHADLYRVASADDMIELGLDSAVQDAILIVEWPERWATPPLRRLELTLHIAGDSTRELTVRTFGSDWEHMEAVWNK